MHKQHLYFVYLLTNYNKTVLYTGVTNNLSRRLVEHFFENQNPLSNKFTAAYNAFYLVYFEEFKYINDAIAREKEIKKWRREKKENLIKTINPEWKFLNYQYVSNWPPEAP